MDEKHLFTPDETKKLKLFNIVGKAINLICDRLQEGGYSLEEIINEIENHCIYTISSGANELES